MEVTAFVTDTVPIRAACLLQRSPEFFKKAVPLPGASLALVGCSTGSCTVVRLFTWAQWTGELYLIPGRWIGLASFLGLWRARWFCSCWFPLGTCTDSPGPLVAVKLTGMRGTHSTGMSPERERERESVCVCVCIY